MKVITIWQPFAQAIANEIKQYETRGWKTHHRGPIAIHSSMRQMTKEYQALATKYGIKDLPTGEVLCIADLVDCVEMTEDFINNLSEAEKSFGDFQVGRFAWKLENIREPKQKIQCGGKQGMWNINVTE